MIVSANATSPHTKIGIRFSDIPGARSLNAVTRKLIAPVVFEIPMKMIPSV